ncbi:MAG: alanyl-tRNA editing protein [Alphaproteobacteria bacterium]|jgi:misacylated tRNA(Ala) deacylase
MELIFREDAYCREWVATVTAVDEKGVWLDQTIFYAEGGGQPGDQGVLVTSDGVEVSVTNAIKGDGPDTSVCVLAEDAPAFAVGDVVTAKVDWERRHKLMRMHTAMHLLCAAVPAGVTGGQVGLVKSRLDFDVGETTLVKEDIQAALDAVTAAPSDVSYRWIDDAELDANPDLVRTMSVAPPRGSGRVRLVEIGDGAVDLQPCGGTHVRNLSEIGRIIVGKIENKGKRNRRVNISLEEMA